jgi:uncharacterized protein
METHHVDPNTVRVWRWHALITSMVLALPLLVILWRVDEPIWLLLLLLYGVLAAYLIWVWPPAYYEALEYGVDEHGIVIHRGVFWRSRMALPRARVQHSDVSQGPLQRRFGVATLKFYTAGSRFTKIELPGLAHEDALVLRDTLLARGGESGV